MPKINYSKAYYAIRNEQKLPRKVKKHILGKRMRKYKLKNLLKSVSILYNKNGYLEEIKPYSFCPSCGCAHTRSTGNMAEYPEQWCKEFCAKCNALVAVIDNGPYEHVLEFKENNYKL